MAVPDIAEHRFQRAYANPLSDVGVEWDCSSWLEPFRVKRLT
jgi:hypothetical protein